MDEKPVLVLGNVFGIFYTVAEMHDSPDDPETKVFLFKEGCRCADRESYTVPVRRIHVFPTEEWDSEECLGRYRVTRRLEIPAGYVAAWMGTTRPEIPVIAPTVDPDAEKCENAILDALETESEIPLRALKKKNHAERYRAGLWDECLRKLEKEGAIRLEERQGRMWATAPTVSPQVPPEIDDGLGAAK